MAGLTTAEAQSRRAAGGGNTLDLGPSRSYWHIIRRNVFTFLNLILFTIGGLLAWLASPADALTTVGLLSLNLIVGLFQEIRAKRKLDQIALLARPKISILRDGAPQSLDPSELVMGDWVKVAAGDQIMADGVWQGGHIEADESLLTGESDSIPKAAGDKVYAGSFCLSGEGLYEATGVGAGSLANQITARARQFKLSQTPLQQKVKQIVRAVAVFSTGLGLFLLWQMYRAGLPDIDQVRMAAVVMGTIPQGLIFLVTLSYALGAVRIGRRGALVQQMNAVESMSHVTALCLDKTGTLTTNEIQLREVLPHQISEAALREHLARALGASTALNRSSQAILAGLGEIKSEPGEVLAEVPFNSLRKWSAIRLSTPAGPLTYVLGAPEMLRPALADFPLALESQIEAWAGEGLRVLLFASTPAELIQTNLPSQLNILGLVCLSDELRGEARETLANFAAAGIKLKIISGDNPQTVAALAAQVGFSAGGGLVSGLDLAKMSPAEFAAAAQSGSIFGRITPDQKEALVKALQAGGEYVAMIGDGVNDVMSLKQADISLAMQHGSSAARSVADIVLMNDSFAVLPSVFTEGQRIVNGLYDTMRLLLHRTSVVCLLMLGAALAGLPFPFLPTQDSLNALLTAGLPPILMALWARSGQARPDFWLGLVRFIAPAALSGALIGLGLYAYIESATGDLRQAQTGLTLWVIFCGLNLIPFLHPPHAWWALFEPLSPRPRAVWMLVGGMAGLLALVLLIPLLRDFFALELIPLTYGGVGLLLGLGWVLGYRAWWGGIQKMVARINPLLL
jgi:cation-transporting ATPase E